MEKRRTGKGKVRKETRFPIRLTPLNAIGQRAAVYARRDSWHHYSCLGDLQQSTEQREVLEPVFRTQHRVDCHGAYRRRSDGRPPVSTRCFNEFDIR